MRDMSRAIRQELQEHGPTLKEIPTETLREYVTIIGAFYGDMTSELNRRSARAAETQEFHGSPKHHPDWA